MNLPSINVVFEQFWATFKRFPLVMIAAFVATVFGVMEIYDQHLFDFSTRVEPKDFYFGIVLTAVFGFLLLLAVNLFLETKKWSKTLKWVVSLIFAAIVVTEYFYFFQNYNDWTGNQILSFILLQLTTGFLLLFAPFIAKGKSKAFWYFVTKLIGRFLLTFVFFGLLFGGMSLLLASIDYLFQIDIEEEYYGYLWTVITGIFASSYFLAHMPKDPNALEKAKDFPYLLKILCKYFLIPLVFLYLLVLYAYGGTIIFAWKWPDGGVAWWTIAFSFVGILTYFFSSSLKEGFVSFVEYYKKWYFVALVPLILVLFFAIALRITDYGLTENRYLVVAYGVWLCVVTVYFIISRSKNLKFLAVSLFVFLVFVNYFPKYNAFSLSRDSQLNRFEVLLEENNFLEDGKAISLKNADSKLQTKVASSIRYLVRNHGFEVLQPWFKENLSEIADDVKGDLKRVDDWTMAEKVMDLVEINPQSRYEPYVGSPPAKNAEVYYYFRPFPPEKGVPEYPPIKVAGFEYIYNFYTYFYDNLSLRESVDVEGQKFKFALTERGIRLIDANANQLWDFDMVGYLEGLVDTAVDSYGSKNISLPEDKRRIEMSAGKIRGEILIQDVSMIYKNEKFERMESFGGYFLFNVE